MKLVLQRVKRCRLSIDGKVYSEIGPGLLVLVGFCHGDGESSLEYLLRKTIELRIFNDEQGKMNRSVGDIGGALMIVSQFTLYGNCRKGRRPSFDEAARPDLAEKLYDNFVERAKASGLRVESGVFAAMMELDFINDGPVTFILEHH